MRLIDADELMTEIMDSDLDHLQRDDWREVIQIVQDAPTIQTQWIPCSERLPEKDGEYLVTNIGGRVLVLRYGERNSAGEVKRTFHRRGDGYIYEPTVVAWMELPEPWRAES